AIELVTESRFIVSDLEKILISGPGDYEVAGISIKAIAAQSRGDEKQTQITVYRLDIAGFRVAILGHIADELSDSQLESIGVIDVLIIPVGGNGYTLDGQAAAKLTRKIDPKIVIPTHYADSALKYEVAQDTLDSFLSSLGANSHEKVDKLKLKQAIHLPEVLKVVELNRT
ncbi:MAG: MBL fold metallo-hydrolase, partial [Segetibacter sp.]